MNPNPLIGVLYHWIGGFASASFYVPYKGVKRWSWEVYWLTGGIFSWVVAPWFFAGIQTRDLLGVLSRTPPDVKLWCIFFGILWGFGGLGYGLVMRYLGLSLGMAVVLGLCTVFGTLIPPLFEGHLHDQLVDRTSGNIVLLGLGLTLVGIAVVAVAGSRKDGMLNEAQKRAAVAEFDFRKGIVIAIFAGIMSACFAFGLAAGEPIRRISAAAGTGPLWTGLPVMCLVMSGGLVTNGIWCAILIVRNRSAGQWLGIAGEGGGRAPLVPNYLFSALAGVTWYFQFFFYSMGESQMGRLGFSSWALHMASIIIFGTIWGFGFSEWKDAGPRVKAIVWSGIGLLLIATAVIGYGNRLAMVSGL